MQQLSFEPLKIIPSKQEFVENPNDELLNNVHMLYTKFKEDPNHALGRIIILVSYILTGLPQGTIQNNQIEPDANMLLTDFITRNGQYLLDLSNRLVSKSIKN